jgi:hypothetical protein
MFNKDGYLYDAVDLSEGVWIIQRWDGQGRMTEAEIKVNPLETEHGAIQAAIKQGSWA